MRAAQEAHSSLERVFASIADVQGPGLGRQNRSLVHLNPGVLEWRELGHRVIDLASHSINQLLQPCTTLLQELA